MFSVVCISHFISAFHCLWINLKAPSDHCFWVPIVWLKVDDTFSSASVSLLPSLSTQQKILDTPHFLYLWLPHSICKSRSTGKHRSQKMLIGQTECNCLCVLVISWNKLFFNAEVRQGLIRRNTIGVKICSRLLVWCYAKSTSSLSKWKFSLEAIGSLVRLSFNFFESPGNMNLKLSISAS